VGAYVPSTITGVEKISSLITTCAVSDRAPNKILMQEHENFVGVSPQC
jgi:hypothetical protein